MYQFNVNIFIINQWKLNMCYYNFTKPIGLLEQSMKPPFPFATMFKRCKLIAMAGKHPNSYHRHVPFSGNVSQKDNTRARHISCLFPLPHNQRSYRPCVTLDFGPCSWYYWWCVKVISCHVFTRSPKCSSFIFSTSLLTAIFEITHSSVWGQSMID